MKIQNHHPLSVTSVQPHHGGHKSSDSQDGDFAKLLSQRQPNPKAAEAAREQGAAQTSATAAHPHAQAPASAHETAHEKSHERPHDKPRTASAETCEANRRDAAKSPAADSLDTDGSTTTAMTKLRGHARASARGPDGRGVAASATQDAQPDPRADGAADANAVRSAAEEPQPETPDPALAQWLATLQLPDAPMPTAPIGSEAMAAQTMPMDSVATSEPDPLTTAPDPLSTAPATTAAPQRLPMACAGGSDIGSEACAGADLAPTEPGAAESISQRSASGAGAQSTERDDMRARDTGAAQLLASTSEQVMARSAALLAPAAGETRPQSIEGIAAPVGISAALLASGPQPVRDIAAPLPVVLATPLTSADFQQALAVQVSVLARDGVQHAELHLHPADMGPVSVRIALDGTLARVEFGADMAATRHAIETGLPELASALRDAGLTLSGGGVSQHSRGRGDASQERAHGEAGAARRHHPPDGEAAARPIRRTVRAGGVDLFA